MSLVMEWRDEGVIIGTRRHGETSVILEVMTRLHGRHLGLVRGGRGKRLAPLLQPGNAVDVTWRARLDEHLGYYAVETTHQLAASLMAAPATLYGLNLVSDLMRLLAEREPCEPLYFAARAILETLGEADVAAAKLVRLEAAILAESGFGLDLSSCAATGAREDLVYVSPRSGRAVSRLAGAPFRDRLLVLPAFLCDELLENISLEALIDGFALTGFFLERDLYAPRGAPMPAARDAYITRLRRDLVTSSDLLDTREARRC